jgi:hypothetical protein
MAFDRYGSKLVCKAMQLNPSAATRGRGAVFA